MKWIKNIGIVVVLAILSWGAFELFTTKADNKRLRSNISEMNLENTSMATTLEQTTNEMARFINVRFPALEAKLDSANIKANRIEKVVYQKIVYRDTSLNRIPLTGIQGGIEKGMYIKEPFSEIRNCLTISGYVEFDGQKLDLVLDDRQYSLESFEILHIRRRQWKLLGFIKTRFLGKRELKMTTKNECGETKTVTLIKANGKWRTK